MIARIILFATFCSLAINGHAARYSLEQLTENNVTGITVTGTITGTTVDGLPFVWPRDTATNSYLEADKILLPLPPDIPLDNIHVEDINNSLPEGEGENVVGWYVDANGFPQSLHWYKAPVERDPSNFAYQVKKLKPHVLTTPTCTGDGETDFTVPECINQNDAKLIYRALACNENQNWQPGDQILVDLNWNPYDEDEEGNLTDKMAATMMEAMCQQLADAVS